jgi:hypothetical protein
MAWICGFLLCAANCGCTSMLAHKSELPLTQQPGYPPPESIVIEFHGSGKKPKTLEMPLEPGMTVDDALVKAKANRKYRRSFVDIRRIAPGGLAHKMPIDFDNGKHRCGYSTNYALHPGDHIIVTEDTSTLVDDLAQRYLGLSKNKH